MRDSKIKIQWLGVFVWLFFIPTMALLSFYAIYRLIGILANG